MSFNIKRIVQVYIEKFPATDSGNALTRAEHLLLCKSHESKLKFYGVMEKLKKTLSPDDISAALLEAYESINREKPEISDFDAEFFLHDREHGWLYDMLLSADIGHKDSAVVARWQEVESVMSLPAIFVDKETIDEILEYLTIKFMPEGDLSTTVELQKMS